MILVPQISFVGDIYLDNSQGWTQSAGIDIIGRKAYFFTQDTNIKQIDLDSFTLTASAVLAQAPVSFVVDNSRGYLYACCSGDGSGDFIYRISLANFATDPLNDYITLGASQSSSVQRYAVMDSRNKYLYTIASNADVSNALVKIDLDTFTVVDMLNVSHTRLWQCCITSDDSYLYILDVAYPIDTIIKVDLSSFTVASATALSAYGYSIFLDEKRNAIYHQAFLLPDFTHEYSLKIDLSTMAIVDKTDVTTISHGGLYDGFILDPYLYLIGCTVNLPGVTDATSGVARINLDGFRLETIGIDPNSDTNQQFAGSSVYDPVTQSIFSSTQTPLAYVLQFNIAPLSVTNLPSPEIEFEVIVTCPSDLDPTVQATTWAPDSILDNYTQKYGSRFKAYGKQAIYLRDTYTTGTDPILKVVSS